MPATSIRTRGRRVRIGRIGRLGAGRGPRGGSRLHLLSLAERPFEPYRPGTIRTVRLGRVALGDEAVDRAADELGLPRDVRLDRRPSRRCALDFEVAADL